MWGMYNTVESSIADPVNFFSDPDPDPWIRFLNTDRDPNLGDPKKTGSGFGSYLEIF